MTTDLRLPPADLEAEEAVIAAAITSPQALDALTFLEPAHFFREKNAWAWGAILDISRRGDLLTQTTVARELDREPGRLDECGGRDWLTAMVRDLATSEGAEWWGHRVESSAQRRRLLSAASGFMTKLYDTTQEPSGISGEFIETLLRDGSRPKALTRSLGDILRRGTDGEKATGLSARLDRYLDKPGQIDGWLTGWDELDNLIRGIQRTRLYTVLGATGVGKTQFCDFLTWNLVKAGVHVLIVSTEMSQEEVGQRLVFLEAGVDGAEIERRGASEDEYQRIVDAQGPAAEWPVFVFDVGQPRLDLVISEIRRQRSQNAIGIAIVDHIQHIKNPKARSEREEIASVSGSLKAAAQNEDIAVIQVSQTGREDAKAGWIRKTSGLGAGAIEQDSNVVITLNRVEHGADGWMPDMRLSPPDFPNIHAHVAKNRHGREGYDVRQLRHASGGRFVRLAGGGR